MQSTVVARIVLFGVSPNLVLLLTISWALLSGVGRGVVVALAGGLALDALSGAPFGAATFSLLAVALVAGLSGAGLPQWAHLLPYVGGAVGTLVYSVVYLVFLRFARLPLPWGQAFAQVVLPQALANTLGIALLYNAMRWARGRAHSQEVEVRP